MPSNFYHGRQKTERLPKRFAHFLYLLIILVDLIFILNSIIGIWLLGSKQLPHFKHSLAERLFSLLFCLSCLFPHLKLNEPAKL